MTIRHRLSKLEKSLTKTTEDMLCLTVRIDGNQHTPSSHGINVIVRGKGNSVYLEGPPYPQTKEEALEALATNRFNKIPPMLAAKT